MNFFSELNYFFSSKKNRTELIRKLLKKNPRWARGHLLLAQFSSEQRVKELSIKAAEIIASNNIANSS